MHKRIKNTLEGIISVYRQLLSLIYEEKLTKVSNDKLDSRTIPPPRKRNPTEKNMCTATLNDSAVLSYASPHVHSSIYWFKYKRDKYTIEFLSRILSDEIVAMTSEKLDNRHNINEWVITFAPSTSFYRGDKKWDHNEDIFEELKKNLPFTFQKVFGFGDMEIESSKKLSKLERQANKFKLLPDVKITSNSGLIIFDDVTTTGSTLNNLSKLAERLAPKIILTVAISH